MRLDKLGQSQHFRAILSEKLTGPFFPLVFVKLQNGKRSFASEGVGDLVANGHVIDKAQIEIQNLLFAITNGARV